MNRLNFLFQQNKFLLILLAVGFLAIIVIPLFLSRNNPSEFPQPSPANTKILPNFPPAQPQEFNNGQNSNQGGLSVDSNTPGVKATIDEKEVQSSEFFAPENITPFVIDKIPEGKHILRASKLGFLDQTLFVEIKNNQVSQVNITLDPDPDFNALQEAIKEMPISADEFYIEYLDGISKIQVIIKKTPFETYKLRAIDWFRQKGIKNPEESGILFYPAVNAK